MEQHKVFSAIVHFLFVSCFALKIVLIYILVSVLYLFLPRSHGFISIPTLIICTPLTVPPFNLYLPLLKGQNIKLCMSQAHNLPWILLINFQCIYGINECFCY